MIRDNKVFGVFMGKYICGKNSVIDALKNKVRIKKLYIVNFSKIDKELLKGIDFEVISKEEMDKMSSLNHQGFLAILENQFSYSSYEEIIKEQPKIILVLDHIEDVNNFGSIIRSANAAGIKHIVIPKERSVQVTETVLKVSSGGIINMKIVRVNSLQTILDRLKKNNYWIYASAIEKGSDYSKVKYNFPLVIVVGNENKGISRTILKQSDQNIFIPMNGSVQSLNVSVATGILLFEIIKKLN